MKADQHHPSCKPSDRDLIWFCNQCGARESAEDVLEVLKQCEKDKHAPNCREILLVYKGSGTWREFPCKMGSAEKPPIRFREVIETKTEADVPKFPNPEQEKETKPKKEK